MAAFVTPDLYDEYSDQIEVLTPMLKNFGGKQCFSGIIQTVKCFEDNTFVKEQVNQPGDNRVLVVDGAGSLRCALLGDQLAQIAMQNHWQGLIINGCIRDVDIIGELEVGVQALAANPRKSIRKGWGEFNIPVQFGGVSFVPGHYVYADNNGVLVSPNALTLGSCLDE